MGDRGEKGGEGESEEGNGREEAECLFFGFKLEKNSLSNFVMENSSQKFF